MNTACGVYIKGVKITIEILITHKANGWNNQNYFERQGYIFM